MGYAVVKQTNLDLSSLKDKSLFVAQTSSLMGSGNSMKHFVLCILTWHYRLLMSTVCQDIKYNYCDGEGTG